MIFIQIYEVKQVQKELAEEKKRIVVYGTGAAIIQPQPDILCYADLTRWEIQKTSSRRYVELESRE